MKLFDLNLDHKFSNDFQKNLDVVYKNLGNHFMLKFEEDVIPMQMHHFDNGDTKFYMMAYYDDTFIQQKSPLRITFINTINGEHDGTIEFSSIRKINDISGTTLVKLAIKLSTILGFKKGVLLDRASIWCHGDEDFDLSLMKLIDSGKTFYEDLGFKPLMNDTIHVYYKYKSIDSLLKKRDKLIKNIKNVKISDLLKLYNESIELLKQNGTSVMSIRDTLQDYDVHYIQSGNYDNFIKNLISSFEEVSRTMRISKKELLGDFIVDLARMNCDKYGSISKFLTNGNYVYIIKNGETEIRHHYVLPLNELKNIKNSYFYEIKLSK